MVRLLTKVRVDEYDRLPADSLCHAAIVARANVHLLLCDILDVELKRGQPGNLNGKQRIGDAKLVQARAPVTNAYRQRNGCCPYCRHYFPDMGEFTVRFQGRPLQHAG
ncbi:hypothetical protein BG60_33580 [Caballeronia zhejiangensis]|uniref:Uncharacterized protein n=1 Tax=Caballeronia zhejiangensis TaxID=871203 RepID=A0A656QA87_9BURK|nr:hypothetical protein BG60_33580 [Caballeronia zhejiangensis]